MALKKPVVQTGTQLGNIQAGDTLDPQYTLQQQSWTNGDSTAAVIGAPVYLSGAATFIKARANAAATSRVAGLVAAASIAVAAQGVVQTAGPLVATTTQWDAVTGQTGGLTVNGFYYLDPAAAGKLTTSAPSTVGQYIAPVGQAQDSTTLIVGVQPTFLL